MGTSPWPTWLAASVLRPSAASYDAYLQGHGYSPGITGAYRHAVGHFAHWLTEEHLELRRLDESVVRRFLTTHLPECRCPGRCQRTVLMVQPALKHLLHVLRANGLIAARCVGVFPTIHDELERFTDHLDHVCGLAARTRAGRRWWVGRFLADRFGQGPIAVHRLSPQDMLDFLGRHDGRYTPGTAGVQASALRTYLRFRAARYADPVEALLAAIPTVASWRLASLLSHLTQDDSARFLNAFDRRHASGQRGYAMARCLLDLGLRASEVVTLQLDDLNWQDGTVRIRAGKSRRADVLPLPVLTGRAIVAYLRQARPPSPSRAVFVRGRAPLDAPITTEIVRYTVRMAFARCGLGARYTGTHVLRRTTATQMRLARASLVGVGMTIADHPLHRSGRAVLPHPALALGDDAQAPQRVGMTDASRGQPAGDKPPHPVPEHAAGLTPTRQRAVLEPTDLKPESMERRGVHGHAVVPDVPTDHRAQPRAHRRNGVVHAPSEFGFHRIQLRLQSLANRLPQHGETSIAFLLPADVREAEKIERLRLPFSAPSPVVGRIRSEFQQSRFLGMQFQSKLPKSFGQCRPEPFGVRLVLESQHEVSGPGELHPQALAEPYVNVSAHTAPSIRPPGRRPNEYQWANSRGSRPATPTSQCAARRWCRRSRLYFRIAHRTRRSLR